MRKYSLLGVLCVALPLLAQAAGEAWNVRLTGHLGGFSTIVTESAGRVYAGMGPRVLAFDGTSPSAPLLGKSPPLGGLVTGIAVSGARVYAAAADGGLRLLDASDPAAITETGAARFRETRRAWR